MTAPGFELTVLVVDPGKITGFGVLTKVAGCEPQFQGTEMPHFEFLAWAEKNIRDYMVVVCESFTVRPNTFQTVGHDRLYATEQIGVLRWWCKRDTITYVEQTPSDAKAFDAKKEKTKALGWWDEPRGSGFKGHRRDAASHALLYAVRHHMINPEVFLG